MGIYYAAVDFDKKQLINAPGSFADKYPGICHPNHPFPGMVVMMNARGSRFEIVNEMQIDYWDGNQDITEKVYQDYLELFKDAT